MSNAAPQNYSGNIVKRYGGARAPYNRNNVTSVTVIAFNDAGKILVVWEKDRPPGFPGGHVEKQDRNHIDAIRREAWEEGRVKLKDIRLAGVVASSWKKKPNGGGTFMLIMAARIDSVHPFNPGGEIDRRAFVGPEAYIHTHCAPENRMRARNNINRARAALNRRVPT